MKVIFTRHAKDKLRREDYHKFQITKKVLTDAVLSKDYPTKTKYGEFAVLLALDGYALRIIYVRLGLAVKVITFHIAKKGRYETKVLQKG